MRPWLPWMPIPRKHDAVDVGVTRRDLEHGRDRVFRLAAARSIGLFRLHRGGRCSSRAARRSSGSGMSSKPRVRPIASAVTTPQPPAVVTTQTLGPWATAGGRRWLPLRTPLRCSGPAPLPLAGRRRRRRDRRWRGCLCDSLRRGRRLPTRPLSRAPAACAPRRSGCVRRTRARRECLRRTRGRRRSRRRRRRSRGSRGTLTIIAALPALTARLTPTP